MCGTSVIGCYYKTPGCCQNIRPWYYHGGTVSYLESLVELELRYDVKHHKVNCEDLKDNKYFNIVVLAQRLSCVILPQLWAISVISIPMNKINLLIYRNIYVFRPWRSSKYGQRKSCNLDNDIKNTMMRKVFVGNSANTI